MPRKGLSMRNISEVLRLAGQGLSYRQIGQSVGISPSTAHGYLERAQRAGVSWPLPDDLDATALDERLFKRSEDELRPGRPEPDWLEVHRERKRAKHVTLQVGVSRSAGLFPGVLMRLQSVNGQRHRSAWPASDLLNQKALVESRRTHVLLSWLSMGCARIQTQH